MRKKFLSGGLLKTGSVIKEAVKNQGFKDLKGRIKKFMKAAYKGGEKDKYLEKQEFKLRKGMALEKAMGNFVKSKSFSKKNIESGKKALEQIKKYNKLKRLEAREYIKSKGKPKN